MHSKSVATQHKINKNFVVNRNIFFCVSKETLKYLFSHFDLFIKHSKPFLIHDRTIKKVVTVKKDKNSNRNEQKSMG